MFHACLPLQLNFYSENFKIHGKSTRELGEGGGRFIILTWIAASKESQTQWVMNLGSSWQKQHVNWSDSIYSFGTSIIPDCPVEWSYFGRDSRPCSTVRGGKDSMVVRERDTEIVKLAVFFPLIFLTKISACLLKYQTNQFPWQYTFI